jgi:hypothetical protein
MAEDKKSFLLYTDLIHTVNKMPNDKAGELFKHILSYVNDLNPETEDLIIQLTFEPIKQQLKRDLLKYKESIIDKSNAGKLGNLKRWHKDLYDKVINNELDLNKALNIAESSKHTHTDNVQSQPIAESRKVSHSDNVQSQPIAEIAVNDNVNVNVNVNDNVINKPSFKKEAKRELAIISESIKIIYPFPSEKFINAWNEWKEYKKKELKQSYKTTISEGKVLKQLATESGNNEEVAIKMIEQAIVRGWKGIYKLQNQNTNQNGTETRTDEQRNAVENFKQRLISSINK